MGFNKDESNSSIRFSLSKYTTKEDLDYVVKELKKIIEKLREVAP
jgi:cysteine desulfurase